VALIITGDIIKSELYTYNDIGYIIKMNSSCTLTSSSQDVTKTNPSQSSTCVKIFITLTLS
jgi:hypothetical protein